MLSQLALALALGGSLTYSPGWQSQRENLNCLAAAVTDISPDGSPLKLSGTISLCEGEPSFKQSLTTNEPLSTFEQYFEGGIRDGGIRVENTSGKPVLSFVIDVGTAFPHGRGNHPYSHGMDHFFDTQGLAAGRFEIQGVRSAHFWTTVPSSLSVVNPSASGRVVFVEFEDGTHFGDPSSAEYLLKRRVSLLSALRAAQRSYFEGGESAVVALLQRYESSRSSRVTSGDKGPIRPEEYQGFDYLVDFQRRRGTSATLEKMLFMIQNAERRHAD
jgi:hypothetical protein